MVSILGCLQEKKRRINIVSKKKDNKTCNERKQKDKKRHIGLLWLSRLANLAPPALSANLAPGAPSEYPAPSENLARVALLDPSALSAALSVRKFGSCGSVGIPAPSENLAPAAPWALSVPPAAPRVGKFDSIGKFGSCGSVGKFGPASGSVGKFGSCGSVGKFGSAGRGRSHLQKSKWHILATSPHLHG
jgi:hypothetical protein